MPSKSPVRSKKAPAAKKSADSAGVSIDFPLEGEEILSGHYAVRISAEPGVSVEINVGGSEWYECRESLGFYWFDWYPSKPGQNRLSARLKSQDGKGRDVAERTCQVAPGGTN
jgi:hypothetical protein